MKKILTSLAIASLLTTGLFSQTFKENKIIDETHQVFINKTRNISLENSTKEFIYFGTLKDLNKEYAEIQKSIIEKGLDGTIRGIENSTSSIAKGFLENAGKGIGLNMGIGLVIGLLDPYVMSLHADEQYILIYDFTNSRGEKTRANALFVASSFDDKEIIRKYLENKIIEEVK